MKRGDVVLIRFPFSDLSGSKVRPALVISDDSYTQGGRDALFIVISSNLSKIQPNDILVDLSDSSFSVTGLKKSSFIRVDKIVVLNKNLARRKLGEVTQVIMDKVEDKLIRVLGLSNRVNQSAGPNVYESVEGSSYTQADYK